MRVLKSTWAGQVVLTCDSSVQEEEVESGEATLSYIAKPARKGARGQTFLLHV